MNICVSFDEVNGLYAWNNDNGDPIEIPYEDTKVNYLSDSFIQACENASNSIIEIGSQLEEAIENYLEGDLDI